MGKRVINEEEFFTQIQRLRSALPKSMKDAEDLMKKAEAVVKSAQGEADRLIDNAEREAERLVTDARTRAERSVSEAKALAERTVAEAKAHSERLTEDTRNRAERTIDDANLLSQKTVEEGNQRAAHAEEEARKRAVVMVAEHEITLRATEEADLTRQTAQNDAEEMRRQADDYAFEVLDKISGVLDKLGSSVEAGKGALRQPAATYANGEYSAEAVAAGYSNGFRN